MSATPSPRPRPLSPHLQIYRPQITSVLSILNRATGIALAVGLPLFTWWCAALAAGPESFAIVQGFLGSILGQFMLFGWTLSLWYHLTNGIRHMVWDTGRGLELKEVYASGYLVVAATVVLTLLTFILGWIL